MERKNGTAANNGKENNERSYIPKLSKTIMKLIRKVCSKNTPTNCNFKWFGKYDVAVQSGTEGYIAVTVNEETENGNTREAACFSIDFWLDKLSIESTCDNIDGGDFTVTDSLIQAARDNGLKAEDDPYAEQNYRFCLQTVHEQGNDYCEEYIAECKNYASTYEKRAAWIEGGNVLK